MSRIRVLHVLDTLETGGLERGVTNLIQRLDPHRFEHVVCAIRNLGAMTERLPLDRVEVACLNKGASGFSFEAGALLRVIRKTKPHVVHSRNWGTIDGLLAGWWSRSCALVYSEHGTEGGHLGPEPARRRWIRRLIYHLADEVFCVSNELREMYAGRTGFPKGKIGVIQNGVDTERFHSDSESRARVRHRLGIPAEAFCIGAIGRLEPVKDIGTLLRAAEALAVNRQYRVIVAGDGSQLSELRQFVTSRPQLCNSVCFAGEVDDVPAVLNALDVYVLPSLAEGISNSLLEAMATGLPVVATDVGGNPEVVVDGQSGMLFPVGDVHRLNSHLCRLSGDDGLRRRLGNEALKRVTAHFSMNTMVRSYDGLYSTVGQPLLRRRAKLQQPDEPAAIHLLPDGAGQAGRVRAKND